MNKKTIITLLLSGICISICMGCIGEPTAGPLINNSTPIPLPTPSIPSSTLTPTSTTPELDILIEFLSSDQTDKINYTGGQRGINYFVCTGFSRTLAKNASAHNITMGAISLRDTPGVGRITKYYHAMNYVILDNSFIIIEPQTDEIFYLDTIQYHHSGVYRYLSIYSNYQMMSNYGKGRETIDIDLREYNETEIINRWSR